MRYRKRRTRESRGRRRVSSAVTGIACLFLCGDAPAQPSEASPRSALRSAVDALKDNPFGSVYLKLRPRYEFADIDGERESHALTLRGVLGFGSRTWHGFSFLVEGEGITSPDSGLYHDAASSSNGRSFVPDPTGIDLNQGYLAWERTEWTTSLRAGRQRIVLDDQRFVGNVGWRQNEQTYDAVAVASGAGRRDVRLLYAYLWEVLRIFGDSGPPSSKDFDSSSHALHARWQLAEDTTLTAFAYLLDFDNAPLSSSNSYGARATGRVPLGHDVELEYALSYAFQTDAADNPDDYEAHYTWVEGGIAWEPAGAVSVGFELLGSDDGDAVFLTPLGTLHQFNGWADAFLDNGGVDGLRDLFVRVRPALPWGFEGELAFHRFWSDEGGDRLGWEVDAYVSRPITRYVTLLAKVAWYDGPSSSTPARPDVIRTWLQLSFEF